MPHTILTPAKRGLACQLAALGLPRREVALRLGCSPRTLRRERQRNPDFERLYDEAEAATLGRPLDHLKRLAETNWRAAAWLLERTKPRKFASRRPMALRPYDFDEACRQIVEAALREVADPELRSRLYCAMDETVEAAGRDLMNPDARARTTLRRPTPLANVERALLDARRDFAGGADIPTGPSGQETDTTGHKSDSWRTRTDDIYYRLQFNRPEFAALPPVAPHADASDAG